MDIRHVAAFEGMLKKAITTHEELTRWHQEDAAAWEEVEKRYWDSKLKLQEARDRIEALEAAIVVAKANPMPKPIKGERGRTNK